MTQVVCVDSICTQRMRLERPTERDREDLHRMHTDARVMQTLGGVQSAELIDEIFDHNLAHWERHGFGWWIARDETRTFLGRGGLRNVRVGGEEGVEVLYGFVAECWGRGLATELARRSVAAGFDQLGLDELVCFTLETNKASQGVMEKAGFAYERPIVHADLPHVLYRLRRAEWTGGF